MEPLAHSVEKFRDDGLYLLFDDGRELTLTHAVIEQEKKRFEANPDMLSRECREAVEFKPCGICPMRHSTTSCHAIPAIFPFLDDINRYLSHDIVTVVYRASAGKAPGGEGVLHVTRTSMQRALQHVAILSLMFYCEIGLEYFGYFDGVIPFMDAQTIAGRLYTNIFMSLRGDEKATASKIRRLRQDLDYTIACQIERLRIVSRSDAFLNAFNSVHVTLQYLGPDMLPHLLERFSPPKTPSPEPA